MPIRGTTTIHPERLWALRRANGREPQPAKVA